MFLVFIHFSRRNCPIAKRRLTTVAGARPDWGGNAQDWGGAIAPPCPMLATALPVLKYVNQLPTTKIL